MKFFKLFIFMLVMLLIPAFAGATTVTATEAGNGYPVYGVGDAGSMKVARGTYVIATALPSPSTIKMCKIPAGATIVGGYLYGDDLDTGTETLDMDIGWSANGGSGTYDSEDTDGLGNLGTITGDVFAAGNLANVVGIMYPFYGKFIVGELPTFTRETTIVLTINIPANAGGTGNVSVVVFYTMD